MIGNIAVKETPSFSYSAKYSPSSADFAQFANEENFARSAAEKTQAHSDEPKTHSASEQSTRPKSMTLYGHTESGNDCVLEWGEGMLVSVGGKGGSVNIKYHESSTEEDPVVVAWGKRSNGEDYKTLIHLNDINPAHATPAEMLALKAHLSKCGYQDASAAGPGALWISAGAFDVFSKMDFEQYYKKYIEMQRLGNNQSGAALYQLELERFLFFHHQNEEKEKTTL